MHGLQQCNMDTDLPFMLNVQTISTHLINVPVFSWYLVITFLFRNKFDTYTQINDQSSETGFSAIVRSG